MTRVLVTGGRDFIDRDMIDYALSLVYQERGITVIIHGACYTRVNADKLAGKWAYRNGVAVLEYPVDPCADGNWPGAGPRRNARMLRHSSPDLVIAFAGGKGTANMIRIARADGVAVWDTTKEPRP